MAKLISKTYGEALFELAVEENKTDVYLEEVSAIREVLKANPEFSSLMNHPKIIKEEKIRVMRNVFEGRITPELIGFLDLIIRKDRYRDIDAILSYFTDKVKEREEIGVAYVTTPLPLNQEQKSKVESRLLETTHYRQMEMNYGTQESLIGGMVIRIGDRVIDSSVSTKISELQKQLLNIQLG